MFFQSSGRPFYILFVIASVVLSACSQSADELQNIKTDRLPNGLEIVVITDTRAPVITHMIWYKAGAIDDPEGKSGIAHYFEHLMFKGTKTLAPGEFSEKIAMMGGSENAFTAYDYTAYFQRISADKLIEVMKLEADRMSNLVFVESQALSERDVVLEERASRTDSSPSALLGEKLRYVLHQPHPYARPIIGWRHEIEKLNLEDAKNFYKRFYAPDNAILVVAGDTDMPEVKRLAAKYYGVIPPANKPKNQLIKADSLSTPETIYMQDVRTRQPVMQRIYRLPEWSRDNAKSFAALELLMEILSSGTTGRLYQSLVVDEKISVGVGGWADTMRRGQGEAVVYISPSDITHIDDNIALLDSEIAKLKAEHITQQELERAKTKILADTLYARDSQFAQARIYGSLLTIGLKVEDVDRWTQNIEAVSVADILKAATLYLDASQSITGILTPPLAASKETEKGPKKAMEVKS